MENKSELHGHDKEKKRISEKGVFKRNLEGNMGISQAVRTEDSPSEDTAEVWKQEGMWSVRRPAGAAEAARPMGVAGDATWGESDWERPFQSYKDLAITLGEVLEGFSGLLSTYGSKWKKGLLRRLNKGQVSNSGDKSARGGERRESRNMKKERIRYFFWEWKLRENGESMMHQSTRFTWLNTRLGCSLRCGI